jgi:DnaJ-class molecular chaperone
MEAVKGVEKKVEIQGKTQTIKIPAGVDNRSRIRFKDYDVLINVQKREGNDLVSEAVLTIGQAALGDVINVATIDGPLSLKIPPGTQSGTLIRLRGKGVADVRGRGRGDQYVRVRG